MAAVVQGIAQSAREALPARKHKKIQQNKLPTDVGCVQDSKVERDIDTRWFLERIWSANRLH